MNPTGPEPASVYWIRRGAIVLVVITVLVALWWLVGSLFGGGSDTSAEAGAEPVVVRDRRHLTPPPPPFPRRLPSAGADPVECPDSAITVEATTDSSTYQVGSTPRLTLTIINTGDVACKRDVGPKANELEITSGGYHVWSSDDCNASNKSKVVTLKPGTSSPPASPGTAG